MGDRAHGPLLASVSPAPSRSPPVAAGGLCRREVSVQGVEAAYVPVQRGHVFVAGDVVAALSYAVPQHQLGGAPVAVFVEVPYPRGGISGSAQGTHAALGVLPPPPPRSASLPDPGCAQQFERSPSCSPPRGKWRRVGFSAVSGSGAQARSARRGQRPHAREQRSARPLRPPRRPDPGQPRRPALPGSQEVTDGVPGTNEHLRLVASKDRGFVGWNLHVPIDFHWL